MCSHYEGVSDPKRLAEHFGVILPAGVKFDVWPAYESIFIRRPKEWGSGDDAVPPREAQAGAFGLVPHWTRAVDVKKALVAARRTYNARSETAREKPSFRDSWRSAHHCVIPAEAIYEPDWRSGKAVLTRISRAVGGPLGIAGLWTGWNSPDGTVLRSFTMLTVNADDHALMSNYHRPDEEKRMAVILHEHQFDPWLDALPERSMEFMQQFPAELLFAAAAPRPSRARGA